ncbi:MAG: type II toxin-antitoxin system VapC family toxin [Gammaproteobacteria bacterium]|nr:type II toxin-antitoxin system VapC family toxin [Gammaproteobacteria bacterium]
MILVDTSVWVEHFRAGLTGLSGLLDQGRVMTHPFVIGELACGNLADRGSILSLLQRLPGSPVASQEEALYFIDRHSLMGRGIGFIDAHLLASTVLAGGPSIWTRDKRLGQVASDLGLAFGS